MAAEAPEQSLVEAVCSQFASAVATLLGGTSSVRAGLEPPADGWLIRLGFDGRGAGLVWLGVGGKDAVALGKRVLGTENDPTEGALRDTLRELAAQAASALMLKPMGAGLDVRVDAVTPTFAGVPVARPQTWICEIGDLTVSLASWHAISLTEPVSPMPAQTAASATSPRRNPEAPDNLDLILDIDLPMSVRFGRTELPLGSLTRLGPGSIIDLGRSPDDPVEVLVSGRVVARGDVVVVGGNYGVRITDVVRGGARD